MSVDLTGVQKEVNVLLDMNALNRLGVYDGYGSMGAVNDAYFDAPIGLKHPHGGQIRLVVPISRVAVNWRGELVEIRATRKQVSDSASDWSPSAG